MRRPDPSAPPYDPPMTPELRRFVELSGARLPERAMDPSLLQPLPPVPGIPRMTDAEFVRWMRGDG